MAMSRSRSPKRKNREKETSHADAAVAPSIRRRREHDARVIKLFKALDIDGDGFLEKRELKRGLRNAAVKSLVAEESALKTLLDPDHWAETFKAIDGTEDDADGRVTFHEFRKYCLHIVSEFGGLSSLGENNNVPTYDQAIALLKLEPSSRKEEHIDSLMIWSQSNEKMKNKLFANLPTDLLREVVREMQYLLVKPGEYVCEQGDIGNTFYLILKGEICVFVRSPQKQKEEMDKRLNDGLTVHERPSVREMILDQRLGKMVATIGPGTGFGELALLAKRAGENKRTATCVCPLESNSSGEAAEPCHLLTLERSVFIRLSKIGENIGTEIGTKVRTLQDSIAFSSWPRSQIVQFSINLKVVKLPKGGILVNAGEAAGTFYLVAGGEIEETQPITIREGDVAPKRFEAGPPGKGGPAERGKIVFPWSTQEVSRDGKNGVRLKKIRVNLGNYGSLDFVGAVPTTLNYPFHMTTLKAACNNTSVICISSEHFHHQAVWSNDKNFIRCFERTKNFLRKSVKLREKLRKQRVRAALAAPDINVTITRGMLRSYSLCGRCGRIGHGWGETNEYGMLRCPLGQGAGERKHNKNDNMEGRRKASQQKRKMRKKACRVDAGGNTASTNRAGLMERVSGTSRFSQSLSRKLRGGTPCTVDSLSSLLSSLSSSDDYINEEEIRQSAQTKLGDHRPHTASVGSQLGASLSPGMRQRPKTSLGKASASFLLAKRRGSAVKLPYPSTSPLLRNRSRKVADMHNILELHGEEAVTSFIRKQMEFVYVMPDEVGFEDEAKKIRNVELQNKLRL